MITKPALSREAGFAEAQDKADPLAGYREEFEWPVDGEGRRLEHAERGLQRAVGEKGALSSGEIEHEVAVCRPGLRAHAGLGQAEPEQRRRLVLEQRKRFGVGR